MSCALLAQVVCYTLERHLLELPASTACSYAQVHLGNKAARGMATVKLAKRLVLLGRLAIRPRVMAAMAHAKSYNSHISDWMMLWPNTMSALSSVLHCSMQMPCWPSTHPGCRRLGCTLPGTSCMAICFQQCSRDWHMLLAGRHLLVQVVLQTPLLHHLLPAVLGNCLLPDPAAIGRAAAAFCAETIQRQICNPSSRSVCKSVFECTA